jgi:hypothetical protein
MRPLVFVDEPVEDGTALDLLLGEVCDRVVGAGRVEMPAVAAVQLGRVFAPRADQPRSRFVWRAGSDARSIAESERVSLCCPDRSADARSDGHVLGTGVLATGKRMVALQAGVGSVVRLP